MIRATEADAATKAKEIEIIQANAYAAMVAKYGETTEPKQKPPPE
jgi:hypothetical protein